MPRRVRRSGLTMPINNPRFVDRSWTRDCDYLNFDLEDSVPQSQKEYARTLVPHAVAQGRKGAAEICVRINCAYPEADVEAAAQPGVSQINFPQSRITDHRIGMTVHNLAQALDGELDNIIEALMEDDRARKLAESGFDD